MHDSPAVKPTIVVWTDISHAQMKQLNELSDAQSINSFFIKHLQLESNSKRTKILCDLFFYALNFARNNKLNAEQTSAFLSILKRVHEMCIRTPFSNMEETYQYFKALILKHSLSRPPHNLRIFTPDVTKKVTDYIVDTYFRHYKMYKYIFTPTIDFNLKFKYEGMTRQLPDAEKDKQHEVAQPDEVHPTDKTEEKPTEEDAKENETENQMAEVRKLIQAYLQEEIRKIQTTVKLTETLQPPAEKQRPVKSGSTKNSKPRTPK